MARMPLSAMSRRRYSLFHTLLAAAALTMFGALRSPPAVAGTVSGTLYDTDYLRAQAGGFEGTAYPRYVNSDGDQGQMVYPSNSGNIYNNSNQYAFVLDTDSGSIAAVQPIYVTIANGTTQDLGRYTYSFPYLPAGTHHLLFVETYRGEVYTPSSKRLTVSVPDATTPVTGDFHLLHQWRLGDTVASIPVAVAAHKDITGLSGNYVTSSLGYVAISTYDGSVSGFYGQNAITIYRTQDGGKTWNQQGQFPAPVVNNFGPADVGYLIPPQYGLHFTDALHGVLMAQANWNFFFWGNGLVEFVTNDGGQTWTLGTSGLTPAQWADPSLDQVNGPLISASIQFVNDYYSTFTAEVDWDPADRQHGVMYGTTSDGSAVVYTRTTSDGGRTWQVGKEIVGGPDIGASAEGALQFFVFHGNNFATLAQYGNGLELTDSFPAWSAFHDTENNPLTPLPGPFVAGRTSGQSAVSELVSNGAYHLFRTNDGGLTWNQLIPFTGSDSYGGSLAHSFSFLSQVADLMSDGGLWLWDTSQDGQQGRSQDNYLSRTYMGPLSILPTYSNSHNGNRNASLDSHTGRRFLLMDPATGTGVSTTVLSYSFDEEASTGPATIMPLAQYVSPHFNAGAGLYVNLVNTGGDWATGITLDSVTATNGVTVGTPQPLPWSMGSLPPGSTTTQVYNADDPGIVFLPITNVPAGVTRYIVTLSGHYNDGLTFRATVAIRQ